MRQKLYNQYYSAVEASDLKISDMFMRIVRRRSLKIERLLLV